MSCACSAIAQVTQISKQDSVDKQTPHLETMAAQLCKWAPPQWGDPGDLQEKTFWKIAAIAVATAMTAAQIAIALKRWELADQYYQLSKDRWSRFKNAYAPFERMMVAHCMSTPVPKPDYDAAQKRGEEHVHEAYIWANEQLKDLSQKYNMCVDATFVADMGCADTLATDDGINFNYRDEEFYTNYLDDRRWNRRNDVLNVGRGTLANAKSFATAANEMLKNFGDNVANTAQGAMSILGYLNNRNETQYPTLFSMGSTALGGPTSIPGVTPTIGQGPIDM